MMMVVFLSVGDLLVLVVLAFQLLLSRRLDPGLRQFGSAHREA